MSFPPGGKWGWCEDFGFSFWWVDDGECTVSWDQNKGVCVMNSPGCLVRHIFSDKVFVLQSPDIFAWLWEELSIIIIKFAGLWSKLSWSLYLYHSLLYSCASPSPTLPWDMRQKWCVHVMSPYRAWYPWVWLKPVLSAWGRTEIHLGTWVIRGTAEDRVKMLRPCTHLALGWQGH